MARISISASGLEKTAKLFDDLGKRKLFQVFREALWWAGDTVLKPEMIEIAENKNLALTNTMIKSIKAQVSGRSLKDLTLTVGPTGVSAKYAGKVEKGQKSPGDYQLHKLMLYAQRFTADPVFQVVLANMIAKSIRQKGSKAYPFIAPTWDKRQQEFIAVVRARAQRKLKILSNK